MRGIALVLTLLVLSFVSALGAGLMLATIPESLAGGGYRDSVAALNAADAALDLAAWELEAIGDWNSVLTGAVQSRFVDGLPGIRRIARREDIDLTVLTNRLTCALDTECSDARVRLSTVERPWGNNNPRWRLFLHSPLPAIAPAAEFAGVYVVVWVGDDSQEADGDSLVDGGGSAGEGASIVRLRADSFGPGVSHRAIEADIVRRNGIHVQSWRNLTPAVP